MAALAVNPQIRPLTPVPAAKTAIRLRPSLAGADPRALPAADTGLLLGDLKRPAGRGPALFASWEDTITAFMAPRSGKTTALSIPYVLSAPGAVVATSNKADLWAATAQLRAGSGSTVWLFDPQRITGSGQRWWWNPLAGLATVEAAHRLASHFVLTVEDNTRRDLWGPAAQDLLCALFLAAASSGRSLRECGRWLADAGSPIPAELLDAAGLPRPGREPARRAERRPGNPRRHLPDRPHRGEMPQRRGHHALGHPAARQALPAFDPAAFAASRDTLYLLTESRSAASPLIAALTDAVMRAGRRQAERAGGTARSADGRGPGRGRQHLPHRGPARAVLPPRLARHGPGHHPAVLPAGSGRVGRARHGRAVGREHQEGHRRRHRRPHGTPVTWPPWSASTTCRSSRSATATAAPAARSRCAARRSSKPADIRALPPGSALLLATGARPALISLRPWYTGPDAPRIAAAIAGPRPPCSAPRQRQRRAAARAALSEQDTRS